MNDEGNNGAPIAASHYFLEALLEIKRTPYAYASTTAPVKISAPPTQ